ncbi:MAG TPA: hypothetical protein VKI00_03955 [Mycobacterium sp.]|uniref:hypothetical protein n=1 Tax=Mycobacterium sp. TaxID=1785 RepID=UPI002C5A8623|nr:hypothetical protein [Mycobacterium sp.]HME74820.1 hypothetical protein [Mycobacterium sp.]
MSDGTTLLFGLPGVKVERVERLSDRMRVVHVSTPEEPAAACPSCRVWLSPLCPRAAVLDHPSARDAVRSEVEWRARRPERRSHERAHAGDVAAATMGSMRQ